MIPFLKKLFVFLLPLGLMFVFPLIVFVLGKEYYSAEDALRIQIENPQAVVSFVDDNPHYKEILVAEKKPKVFAIGTSRAETFRKEFFTESARFVTASHAVSSIDGMKSFIEKLPSENKTQLIIFVLDPGMFLSGHPIENEKKGKLEIGKELFFTKVRNVYFDYFSGKFSLKELWHKSQNTKNIGLFSIIENSGFREDGSSQYPNAIIENINRVSVLKNAVDSVVLLLRNDKKREDISYNEYREPLSKEMILSLNELLTLCEKKNIQAIGLFSPKPPVIYRELTRSDRVSSQRVKQLSKTVGKVFSDHHFSFFDFSDISLFDGSDTEFLDQWHGTDKLYLRMTVYMAERNKLLAEFVDIPKTKQLLKETKSDFLR